jgi:hypothetical protein
MNDTHSRAWVEALGEHDIQDDTSPLADSCRSGFPA